MAQQQFKLLFTFILFVAGNAFANSGSPSNSLRLQYIIAELNLITTEYRERDRDLQMRLQRSGLDMSAMERIPPYQSQNRTLGQTFGITQELFTTPNSPRNLPDVETEMARDRASTIFLARRWGKNLGLIDRWLDLVREGISLIQQSPDAPQSQTAEFLKFAQNEQTWRIVQDFLRLKASLLSEDLDSQEHGKSAMVEYYRRQANGVLGLPLMFVARMTIGGWLSLALRLFSHASPTAIALSATTVAATTAALSTPSLLRDRARQRQQLVVSESLLREFRASWLEHARQAYQEVTGNQVSEQGIEAWFNARTAEASQSLQCSLTLLGMATPPSSEAP